MVLLTLSAFRLAANEDTTEPSGLSMYATTFGDFYVSFGDSAVYATTFATGASIISSIYK